MKDKVKTLKGHSNWVKNIEYNTRDNMLVTSGFDGAIYTWDINKYQDSSSHAQYRRVFSTNGLMRMRLTAANDKMIISTMNGYLIVIHDLDMDTLSDDLAGFKPNVYRLMQISGKPIEMAVNYTHLFHAKRNRVEMISDWPEGDDAEVLSSLKLHPQGWVAVTRNVSSDERSEWLTVHDVQTLDTNPEDDAPIAPQTRPLMYSRVPRSEQRPVPSIEQIENDPSAQRFASGNIEIISTGIREESGPRPVITIDLNIRRRARRLQEEEDETVDRSEIDGLGIEVDHEDGNDYDVERGEGLEVDGENFISANSLSALEMFGATGNGNVAAGSSQEESSSGTSAGGSSSGEQRNGGGNVVVVGAGGGRPRILYFGTPGRHRAAQQRIPKDAKIHRNVPRLTHFIEESNKGKGFIKEISFSPCGRFIASPFSYGVRLLSFSASCSDLSDCYSRDGTVVKLHEVGSKFSHNDVVLSTAFSPHHWLLVTGCLMGRVSWHQPVL